MVWSILLFQNQDWLMVWAVMWMLFNMIKFHKPCTTWDNMIKLTAVLWMDKFKHKTVNVGHSTSTQCLLYALEPDGFNKWYGTKVHLLKHQLLRSMVDTCSRWVVLLSASTKVWYSLLFGKTGLNWHQNQARVQLEGFPLSLVNGKDLILDWMEIIWWQAWYMTIWRDLIYLGSHKIGNWHMVLHCC